MPVSFNDDEFPVAEGVAGHALIRRMVNDLPLHLYPNPEEMSVSRLSLLITGQWNRVNIDPRSGSWT